MYKTTLPLLFIFMLLGVTGRVLAQEQKPPTLMERAVAEADRLEKLLDLDGWQTFYVDSTLRHDFQAMQDEFDDLAKAKVENNALYQMISDKWWEQIDKTYKEKIFTPEQWQAYLKSGGERLMKARAKRREKAEKASQKIKKITTCN